MPASPTATFPAAIDSPQAPSQFDSLATDGVEHDFVHDWAMDAIKKIEQKLGITSSPDVTSVDYVLKNHQHQGTDRSAQISRLPIKMLASQTLPPVEVQNNLGITLSEITAAGEFLDIGATAATLAIRSYVTGDTNDRFQIQADGKILWGPGNAALGTAMYRTGVGQLRIDNQLGVGISPTTFALDVSGTARISGALTLTVPLAVAQGGTGSATQNFVDLSTSQTIGGTKTFAAPALNITGSAAAVTVLYVNAVSGQTSPLLQTDVAGISKFRVSSTGMISPQGGIDVSGSPSGYTGGELRFGNAAGDAGISTLTTSTQAMNFDHRGAGNTGIWNWRSGTNAAALKMSLQSDLNVNAGDIYSRLGDATNEMRMGIVGGGLAAGVQFGSSANFVGMTSGSIMSIFVGSASRAAFDATGLKLSGYNPGTTHASNMSAASSQIMGARGFAVNADGQSFQGGVTCGLSVAIGRVDPAVSVNNTSGDLFQGFSGSTLRIKLKGNAPSIVLPQVAAASVPTDAAGQTFFFDLTTGAPRWRDSSGNLHSLTFTTP